MAVTSRWLGTSKRLLIPLLRVGSCYEAENFYEGVGSKLISADSSSRAVVGRIVRCLLSLGPTDDGMSVAIPGRRHFEVCGPDVAAGITQRVL